MFVDPDPGYGSAYEIEDADGGPEQVTLEEDGPDRLAAHRIGPRRHDREVWFVDGVRRTDARVHEVDHDGPIIYGLAGSFGVGGVRCPPGQRPTFGRLDVHRRLIWTHGFAGELPEVAGWYWQVDSLTTTAADALLLHLQDSMRRAEADLAARLVAGGGLVVRDGPLIRLHGVVADVAGLVKSHNQAHLPPELHRSVPSLIGPCERSSLFSLRDDVWACYFRLPTSGRVGPWAGIVRIDLPATGGLAGAVTLADEVCAHVAEYPGVAHIDPRAPANLQPVGALERQLRHLLGDPAGALRACRDAAHLYERAYGAA